MSVLKAVISKLTGGFSSSHPATPTRQSSVSSVALKSLAPSEEDSVPWHTLPADVLRIVVSYDDSDRIPPKVRLLEYLEDPQLRIMIEQRVLKYLLHYSSQGASSLYERNPLIGPPT